MLSTGNSTSKELTGVTKGVTELLVGWYLLDWYFTAEVSLHWGLVSGTLVWDCSNLQVLGPG